MTFTTPIANAPGTPRKYIPIAIDTPFTRASAVLPPFERVILDEAHHLEDVATSYFSAQITRFTFSRVLNRLRHPRKPNQGLLPRFLDQLSQQLPESEDDLYRADGIDALNTFTARLDLPL